MQIIQPCCLWPLAYKPGLLTLASCRVSVWILMRRSALVLHAASCELLDRNSCGDQLWRTQQTPSTHVKYSSSQCSWICYQAYFVNIRTNKSGNRNPAKFKPQTLVTSFPQKKKRGIRKRRKIKIKITTCMVKATKFTKPEAVKPGFVCIYTEALFSSF